MSGSMAPTVTGFICVTVVLDMFGLVDEMFGTAAAFEGVGPVTLRRHQLPDWHAERHAGQPVDVLVKRQAEV